MSGSVQVLVQGGTGKMLYRAFPDDIAEAFDTFWRSCPRRQGGKLEAEREYRKALEQATVDELQAGMGQYAAHVRRQHLAEQFIVTPAKWLQRGMWADEYEEKKDTRPAYQPYTPLRFRREG